MSSQQSRTNRKENRRWPRNSNNNKKQFKWKKRERDNIWEWNWLWCCEKAHKIASKGYRLWPDSNYVAQILNFNEMSYNFTLNLFCWRFKLRLDQLLALLVNFVVFPLLFCRFYGSIWMEVDVIEEVSALYVTLWEIIAEYSAWVYSVCVWVHCCSSLYYYYYFWFSIFDSIRFVIYHFNEKNRDKNYDWRAINVIIGWDGDSSKLTP